jgi:hypothetical protein
MKFGSSKTGMVDNVKAGGILCCVDIKDGTFNNAKIYEDGRAVDLYAHPDTGAPIEGTLEFWGPIKEKLIEIGRYIPQVKYMGFDIIVTDDGFKIIEINSHQGNRSFELFYPIMSNEHNRRLFSKLFAAQPKRFRNVLNQIQKYKTDFIFAIGFK